MTLAQIPEIGFFVLNSRIGVKNQNLLQNASTAHQIHEILELAPIQSYSSPPKYYESGCKARMVTKALVTNWHRLWWLTIIWLSSKCTIWYSWFVLFEHNMVIIGNHINFWWIIFIVAQYKLVLSTGFTDLFHFSISKLSKIIWLSNQYRGRYSATDHR